MTAFDGIVIDVEVRHVRRAMREAMPVEAVARELHDTVFAWHAATPPWDDLKPKAQKWFMDRAGLMIERLLGE